MNFESTIGYLEKLKLFYVRIPEHVLAAMQDEQDKSKTNQRFKITLEGKLTWTGGSVALEEGNAYITVSKARMRELEISLHSKVHVFLEKDHSEFGMDVPEEFLELLSQDSEARRRFYLLSKGIQRATIYIVNQLKSQDKRIEKSLFLFENLKRSPEKKTTMRHILGKD